MIPRPLELAFGGVKPLQGTIGYVKKKKEKKATKIEKQIEDKKVETLFNQKTVKLRQDYESSHNNNTLLIL